MIEQIKNIVQESIAAKQTLLHNQPMLASIAAASQAITTAFQSGHRVYFCGNGGSAADAQHLAAELTGAFYNRNRPALPAEALHCNTSYLTAVANDYDYSVVYMRLIQGIGQPGDVLIGLSTSGNSPNIVKALEQARKMGIVTIGMTGQTGGQLKPLSDYLFNIPSGSTPRIQEAHMLIGHIICELVEAAIFPPEAPYLA